MPDTTFTLRASAAPLAALCPQSIRRLPDEVRINEHNVMAQIGSAIHKGIEWIISNGLTAASDDLALQACSEVGCPATPENLNDVGQCLRRFVSYWHYGSDGQAPLKGWFPDPVLEEALEDTWCDGDIRITVTGHPDLTSVHHQDSGPSHLSIVDWKSGRAQISIDRYREQLAVGAWLKLGYEDSFEVWTISATVLDLRGGEAFTIRWDSMKELCDEVTALFRRICTVDEYCTGAHCTFCPCRLECRAWAMMHRNLVQMFAPSVLADGEPSALIHRLRDLEPQIVGDIHQRIRILKATVERAWSLLRGELGNGPLDIGGGKQLILREEGGGSDIDPVVFAGVAEPVLGPSYLECYKVSKTKALLMVKAKADKGQKGKAAAQFMATLEELGGVTPKPPRMVMRVQKKPEAEIEVTQDNRERPL